MSNIPPYVSEQFEYEHARLQKQSEIITPTLVGTPTDDHLANSIRSFKRGQTDIWNIHLLENIAIRVEQLIQGNK